MKELNSTGNFSSLEKLLYSNETFLYTESANSTFVGTVVIVTVLVIISLVSVLGNALVLTAIYMNYNLRTVGNVLFGNLALSDFLQGGIAIPCRIVELLYPDCNYILFCPASIALSILFGGSSNLSILFISIERFIGVRWPFLYYSFVTTKVVYAVIMSTWISLVLLASLPLLGWGGLTNHEADMCRFPLFLTKGYISAVYVFIHILPLCIIVPLYIFILNASLKSIRKIHIQEHSVRSPANDQQDNGDIEETDGNAPRVRKNKTTEAARQRKSAKTVSLVVGLFILLIMPIVVVDIVDMSGGPRVPPFAIRITVMMAYANHCVNVFVYAGCSGDYKRAFTKILSRFKSNFTKGSH